jgi:hypothetical protein
MPIRSLPARQHSQDRNEMGRLGKLSIHLSESLSEVGLGQIVVMWTGETEYNTKSSYESFCSRGYSLYSAKGAS